MHPDNILINGYDFLALVEEFEDLKSFLIYNEYNKPTLDFSNKDCVRLFNQALLKKYYHIEHWSIPDSNLCPTVPGRADYLHFIKDLIGDGKKKILDIGTGASIIYPLLGNSIFDWSFVASDTDYTSLTHGKSILKQNNINVEQIELRLQKDKTAIFNGVVNSTDQFDVSICNPPFFETAEQALKWNQKKWKTQSAERIGTNSELIYDGGEKAFISNMVKESIEFQKQIELFSCLVSKKSTIDVIQKACKQAGTRSLEFIEIKTGRKVSRIAVWNF